MLTAKNLERMIALEDRLKEEYQTQIDAKTAELETCTQKNEEQTATIAKQLEQIKSLSAETSSAKKLEQQNRELHQRCENTKEEMATQKTRMKSLQKDLADERTEVKSLKQFDPAKMKKNLDATKKKLTEKTTATDLLQKSLNKSRSENVELESKVKELEAKVAELEVTETEEEVLEEAAA
jgi:chromosome segregation ATPase